MDHGLKMPSKRKKLDNNLSVILDEHPQLLKYANQRALITHEQKSRAVQVMKKVGSLPLAELKQNSLLKKALEPKKKVPSKNGSEQQLNGEEEDEQIPPEIIKYDFLNRKGVYGPPGYHQGMRKYLLDNYLKQGQQERDKKTEFALKHDLPIPDSVLLNLDCKLKPPQTSSQQS